MKTLDRDFINQPSPSSCLYIPWPKPKPTEVGGALGLPNIPPPGGSDVDTGQGFYQPTITKFIFFTWAKAKANRGRRSTGPPKHPTTRGIRERRFVVGVLHPCKLPISCVSSVKVKEGLTVVLLLLSIWDLSDLSRKCLPYFFPIYLYFWCFYVLCSLVLPFMDYNEKERQKRNGKNQDEFDGPFITK